MYRRNDSTFAVCFVEEFHFSTSSKLIQKTVYKILLQQIQSSEQPYHSTVHNQPAQHYPQPTQPHCFQTVQH
jgi:hypothetical protein